MAPPAAVAPLELGQELTSPGDDGRREPGQPGHLDAVAPVRAAFLQPPEEDDVVAGFQNPNTSGNARRIHSRKASRCRLLALAPGNSRG